MINRSIVEEDSESSLSRSTTSVKNLIIVEDQVSGHNSVLTTSRFKIGVIWTLTVSLVAAMFILAPREDQRATEAVFMFSTILGKFAILPLSALTYFIWWYSFSGVYPFNSD